MSARTSQVFVNSALFARVLARHCPDRVCIGFSVGDAANAGSVVITDQHDATRTGYTNGFLLTWSSGIVWIEGEAASHRWTSVRASGNTFVGVIEVFMDNFPDGREPDSGHRV